MADNYKGLLIELCTKNNLEWQFNLIDIQGPPHDPKFRYSVIIDGITVKSPYLSSKKAAQQEVSKMYLESCDMSSSKLAPFPIDSLRQYYIDLENCADIDLTFFKGNYEAVASIGTSKAVLKRAKTVTRCTRSDAADVALIAKLTEDIVMGKYQKYGVVSRDKLLLTAVEVLKDLYQIDIEAVIL